MERMIYRALRNLGFITLLWGWTSATTRAQNCEATYNCGGCNGAWAEIRCVCRSVENQIQCLRCDTNNPCQGQCMECCYRNLGTGQTSCSRATCNSRTVWCSSGCSDALESSERAGPGVQRTSGQPSCPQIAPWGTIALLGTKETLVSNGLTIESVDSTGVIRVSDPAMITVVTDDGKSKRLGGVEFTLTNLGSELLVAHGLIFEVYWRGRSEPVRFSQVADGWFHDGGLGPGQSARYQAGLLIEPADASLLERLVVGVDYAETRSGSLRGADHGRFGDFLRNEREVQRRVTAAVRSLAASATDTSALRQQIRDLASAFDSMGGRAALAHYSQVLEEAGIEGLRREVLRRP
jgi:hypothetical protein